MGAASSIHDEVEIKLDADPQFVLPELSQLPGVTSIEDGGTHQLIAHYLDSADLRLARRNTTLRRRTGGTDEGWHLKLPSGKDQVRTEIHDPLGESVHSVPPLLLSLVRVHLRGASAGPVAQITTTRTTLLLKGDGGEVLAEVADDHVVAEALGEEMTSTSWREIEVELGHGDMDLLEAVRTRLLDAGARPASSRSKLQRTLSKRLSELAPSQQDSRTAAQTAGSVAAGYLAQQVSALTAEDPHVRMDIRDGIHQMRVATRRLRTALATFRPLFKPGSGQELRDELKWLGGVLGQARDAEVMRSHLQTEVAQLPAELVLGPIARRVDLELNAAHQQAYAAVIETLDGDRYLRLVQSLEAFVASPPFTERADASAGAELRRLVRRACRRTTQAADAADAAESPAERDHLLHEVRKTAKRARYAAEAVQPVIGKPARRVATVMEAIQENLGDHQDAVVERAWLRDLGVRAFLAGENGFTFGLLHGRTELRAEHDEQEFTLLWKQARKTVAAWPGKP